VLTRSHLQRLIGAGQVLLNGKKAKASLRLRGGETIEILPWVEPSPSLEAEAIPLEIVYEDADLAVVNKPAGLVVHAGAGVQSGTLVNALLHHFRELSSGESGERPGIVHRLDKQTSGLLVVAKNDRIHHQLSALFQARQVHKEYLVLVHGRLQRPSGKIASPIGRDRIHRIKMSTHSRRAREALTSYEVIENLPGFSLVRVVIQTGRTHQIRVHLSSLRHPVVGDTLYGAPARIHFPGSKVELPALGRNFLHAARLEFLHPRTGQPLKFAAPLPPELQSFLEQLRVRAKAGNPAWCEHPEATKGSRH
jgi:23S rRNA pseudouridine1911/1915/1917 synthase